MILSLSFLALLIAVVSRQPIPAATGGANGTADLFRDVRSRVALPVFATLSLVVVRSIGLDRYGDSRQRPLSTLENKMTPLLFSRKNVPSAVGCLLLLSLSLSSVISATATEGARVVAYSREDIIPVRAKLRFSTLIVLPDNEEILDFTTGDKEFWIVNGAHNLCYVHPAQAGIRSNLNLITASGNVYSFLLTEISGEPNAQPDLKLFVQPKESSATTSLAGYVRAGEAEAYRKEVERLRTQTDEQVQTARSQASEQVDRFRSEYPAKLRFDYVLDKKSASEPFLVSAIYHDDRFTYIRCDAREKPALYEVKDGKPNLINFQLQNGVYIASQIIDAGYLVVGRKKLAFSRRVAAN